MAYRGQFLGGCIPMGVYLVALGGQCFRQAEIAHGDASADADAAGADERKCRLFRLRAGLKTLSQKTAAAKLMDQRIGNHDYILLRMNCHQYSIETNGRSSVLQTRLAEECGRMPILAADRGKCYTLFMKKIALAAKRYWMPLLSGILFLLALIGLSTAGENRNPIRASSQELTVYFLDVGQADAALVLSGGSAMLIDGGNVADSSYIVAFLRDKQIRYLDAVICTHAHEDHVGGLAAALKECSAGTIYAPVTDYDSKSFQNFCKYADKRGKSLTVPKAGDSFLLGGAMVTFLSPVAAPATTNDTSLVVRIDLDETGFLFMGDAERVAEQQLLESGARLSADVLKVGHHGSDGSSSYVFIREVMPRYAVISVEHGNRYGLPDEAVLSRLADAGSSVYRTDLCGTICCKSDGRTLTFSTERDYDPRTVVLTPEEELQSSIPAGTCYIGNKNSGKFHKLTCSGLPAEWNRVYFETRDAAVADGYVPCGRCNP